MKKLLAIVLSMMLVLSMLPALGAAEDVVTVTAMWSGARPQNEFTDETRQYIRDNLGIDLELTQVTENFEQQLALAVSSGDIPDLIWMDYDTYVTYAKEGLFYDIGELVKQYPDLMAYVDTNGAGDYCWDRMTIDGAIYGVPTRSINKTMYTAAIRQDWLDKLGLKVPETLDELTEVLRAFTEDDPDGDGIANTYGVSFTGLDYGSVFFGAFGATSGMDYLLNEDGTVTTNVISDQYKAALTYLKEIYDKVKVLEDKIVREIIEESDVIVSTNSSAALDVIAKYKFDVAVIDEASQTTIPSVLIPIAKAHRFILAGDHKQLPPTVISTYAYELEETLFESLIEKYPHKGQLLNVQYRMNDELMRFSNSQFYDNLLETDSSVFDITLNDFDIDDEKTMEFIDTSNMNDNREAHLNDSKSFVNRTEARICLKLANDYLDKGVKKEDIGIISPYADQVKLISEHIDVEVKSVDGFQGREKEIIIISTVRSNDNGELGFLNDLRRLNVAITRAKRKLIIVGNQDTLKYNRTYEKLIKSSLY